MLTAIKIAPSSGLFGRWFGKKMRMSVGKLCGLDCLYILCRNRNPDYDKIRRMTGRAKRHLLLPIGLQAPDDIGIIHHHVKQKILIRSALEAVSRAKPSSVALIDPDARHSGIVPALIRSAGRVLIVTSRVEEYSCYCAQFQKEYGHIPIVTDSTELVSMCSALIAPDGFDRVCGVGLDAVSFAPDSHLCFSVDERCIDFPFDTTKNTEYSPLDIYAALVVMSTDKQRTLPLCHSFVKNGAVYPIEDVVQMITALDMRGSSNYNINIANLFQNE